MLRVVTSKGGREDGKRKKEQGTLVAKSVKEWGEQYRRREQGCGFQKWGLGGGGYL